MLCIKEINPLKKCNGGAALQGLELGFWWNGEAPFWADAEHPGMALQSCSSSEATPAAVRKHQYLGLPAVDTL